MKTYNHYKSNNKQSYDYEKIDLNIKPKEAILLNCIKCKTTYTSAYKCKDEYCPLYQLKSKWMKRPHTASQWFLNNKTNISDIKKCQNNQQKNLDID